MGLSQWPAPLVGDTLAVRREEGCKAMDWPDQFSDDDIVAFVKKLGRAELLEIAEDRLSVQKGVKTWKSLNAGQLAAHLFERLPRDEVGKLAAAGLRKQRQPSIGGPSWQFDGAGGLSADVVRRAIPRLHETLGSRWRNVELDLRAPAGMLEGVVDISYTTETPQASGDRVVLADADCPAMILLDYTDAASTVSARSDTEQRFIGVAWAHALGSSSLVPLELNFTPSVADDQVSDKAIQMLEAVYGRLATVGRVINIDHIWTKRQDPDAQVQEQMARGEAGHVLADSDVRNSLRRGDLITGLAFRLEYRYKGKRGGERLFVPHVTVASENGTLILRVTRAGHDFDLASYVYQELRRALARATPWEGLRALQSVIDEIK